MPRKAPKIDDSNLQKQLLGELLRGTMSWADSCKVLRASQGLTQQQFADRVGVAVNIIRELESGSGNPTLASLSRIAECFDMKVGFVKPASGRTVSLGTESIVRQRQDERLALLRDLKHGKTTHKKVHSKNALRGTDFKIGLAKLT